MADVWPLIGRSAELSLIQAEAERAARQGMLLSGPAGVGKTRLIREAVDQAGQRGQPALLVRASTSTRDIPLGAFAAVLPAHIGRETSQLGMLQAACGFLDDLAGDGRLLLAVDDVHLLDPLSVAVLLQTASSGCCFVLTTWREDESLPPALTGLLDDHTFERVPLSCLDEEQVRSLVAQVLGGAVDAALHAGLWRLSGGNPLLLREILAGAMEAGLIVQRDHVWTRTAPLVRASRLRDLVENRLAALGSQERLALDLLALGEPLPLAVLSPLVEHTALSVLDQRGLLDVQTSGLRKYVSIASPLYALVLSAHLPGLRRRELCHRLADQLDSVGNHRGEDTVRLAQWRLEGGQGAGADLLLAGALCAQSSFDLVLGERLAEASILAGSKNAGRLALAEAFILQRRFADAEQSLDTASAAADSAAARSAVRVAQARTVHLRRGDIDAGLALLDRADDDWQVTPQSAAVRSALLSYRGDLTASVNAAGPALTASDDDRAALDALTSVTFVQALTGQGAAALAGADRGLRIVDSLEDSPPFAHAMLQMNRTLALAATGQVRAAAQEAVASWELAVQDGVRQVAGALGVIAGYLLIEHGNVNHAARVLDRALTQLAEHDLLDFSRAGHHLRALAAAMVGEPERATACLVAGTACESAQPDRWAPLRARAEAWAAWMCDETTQAVDLSLAGAEGCRQHGSLLWAATFLHDVARFGAPSQVQGALHHTAAAMDGQLGRAMAAHVDALVGQEPNAMQQAGRSLETAGMLAVAAEAYVDAAALARTADDLPGATALEARGRGLLQACGLVRTCTDPAPRTTSASELTPRESEIASLAARGWSSSRIARHLVISLRTVENHLHRSYVKLGVSGRAELPATMTRSV